MSDLKDSMAKATAKPTPKRDVPGVTIGMAINNAAAWVHANWKVSDFNLEEEHSIIWAKAVVRHAEALLDEMAKRGL